MARLKAFYRDHPGCTDLLQGPLVYDDLQNISTHFAPEWRAEMWGTWATDPRGHDPEGDPFEIPMQGLGAFSCRKEAWPGFNPRFRGFGGEEGYIHEKFRRAGGRCLCLPWFRWLHRFGRPAGVPYPLTVEDKLRNYLIGHAELGLDLDPVLAHFSEWLPQEKIVAIAEEALGESGVAEATVVPPPEIEADAAVSPAPPAVIADGDGEASSRTRRVAATIHDTPRRRAIVCYVDDHRHLIQQALALRHSWLYAHSPDTDLVMMGPGSVLASLPDDVVKIEQRSVEDDPQWRGYPYANSIICMNGAGAERLDRYTHVLRTDVDTFITPAWNDFQPATFMFGNGAYSNDEDVRRWIRDIAARHGLAHRRFTNIGSTWYGPTEVVRRASAFTEMLLKYILMHCFADHEGEWPGWYWGVSLLYAGEIAVNHCAPDAHRSESLDSSNTSRRSSARYAHIHCWHTDDKFSKHAFVAGQYTREDAQDLDVGVVADYCMEMSFRSLRDVLRNDLSSHAERGLDLQPVLKHFSDYLSQETIATIAQEALWGSGADARA